MDNLLQGVNVYLIGMMGSGKTTVGKLLAEKLQYRFLDTDALIETISKNSINNIFAQEGEDYFRQLESQVLGEVSIYLKTVIATGGGIILKPENWSYLHHGMIIWLDTPIDILVKRLAEDQTRPLLKNEDLTEKLTNLIKQRKSLYQQADITITVEENDNPSLIVEKIITAIPSKIKTPVNPELN